MNCASCSAPISPELHSCPYCGKATPYALEARRQAEAREREREAQRIAAESWEAARIRHEHRAAISKSTNLALLFSIVSLFSMCCFPVSILGGVFAIRTILLSRRQKSPVPVGAMIALVLSAIGFLISLFFLGWFVMDQRAHTERLEDVRTRLEKTPDDNTLSQKRACLLVEEYLLTTGHDKHTLVPDSFVCDGEVTRVEERARLSGVRAAWGSAKYNLVACFERDDRWEVSTIGKGLTCEAGETPPNTTPSTPTPRKGTRR